MHHCPPPPPPPTGNSGDNNFSSIKALLKAQDCRNLLIVIALLFIKVNSTGVYLCNFTYKALQGNSKGPRYPPPIPVGGVGGGGWGAMVTNDWCITVLSVDSDIVTLLVL